MNKKVLIIGLGLIGGSIALAIRQEHSCVIRGYDISNETLKVAKSLKIIDEIVDSVDDGIKDVDLIILATPVSKTEQILSEVNHQSFKQGVIITDVGSTKANIVSKATEILPEHVTFIGGHPMAGSHKTGVEAAREHLFENAFYILTPMESTDNRSVIQLQNWLKGTKAKFINMTPKQHDYLAGAISHFPHIVATSLVNQIAKMEEDQPLLLRLAAGGFRDITRIASASPVMWRDILIHNKEVLLPLLDNWISEIKGVQQILEQNDEQAIYQYFDDAKVFRDQMPERTKGAIPAFYDLFVDVPDHPGVISDVTSILATQSISITNIRILETREDIMGVLRLSFRSEEDRQNAKNCLEQALYETSII
ncbi:prephenate dehydrogenase [Bacillus sp. TS-2]|nr:prephenate dehydrogenase [Bacillus sp. TS-2]